MERASVGKTAYTEAAQEPPDAVPHFFYCFQGFSLSLVFKNFIVCVFVWISFGLSCLKFTELLES